MFDLNTLKVNPEKASEGAWVDYIMGSKLRVARSNNKEAEDYRMQKAIEHADVFQSAGTGETEEDRKASQEKADSLATEIENHALAHFVLKDWSGIQLDGKDAKYTPEVGIKLLANPEFTDFREDLLRISRNRQHFKSKAEEAAVKSVKKTAAS